MPETLYPQKLPMGPETEPPVQYTLPFRWGTLRVSEAAHQAYGFTPLKEGIIEGSNDQIGSAEIQPPGLRVDIWMVSPDEMGEPPSSVPPAEDLSLRIMSAQRVHQGGIAVVEGLSKDRNFTELDLQQQMKSDAEDLLKYIFDEGDESDEEPEEVNAENLVGTNGMTIDEIVEQNTTQMMIGTVCKDLAIRTQEPIARWIKNAQDKFALRSITKAGGFVLLSTGIVAATGAAISMDTGGHVDDIAAAVATVGASGIGLKGLRDHLKAYMRANAEAEPFIRRQSSLLAIEIANDIYKSYSSQHFNEMFDQSVEDQSR